jgi:hypothetical protein
MSVDLARTTIESAFNKRLVLRIGSKRVAMAPSEVAARASVDSALRTAQSAAPGSAVTLTVSVNNYKLHKYVRKLGKRFNRAAVDAQVFLRHLRPRISEGKVGWTIKVSASQRAIRAALAANRRAALTLPLKKIARKVIKANFGSVIVIRRGSNRLYLYKGERFVRRFSVATGQSAYPTPLGHYAIVVKHGRTPGGIRPTRPGPRARSRFRPDLAIRSARAGWACRLRESAFTARPNRARSAIRFPTAAFACTSPTPSGCSRTLSSERRSSSSRSRGRGVSEHSPI